MGFELKVGATILMPVVGAMTLAQGLAILGSDGGLADIAKLGVNGLLCPVNNYDF